MFNEAGTQVVWYEAWANRVGGAWAVHNQDIYKNLYYVNPFGYRGYYLDTETGFYYCGIIAKRLDGTFEYYEFASVSQRSGNGLLNLRNKMKTIDATNGIKGILYLWGEY